MRVLIVGGTSSLGKALLPVLSEFAEVMTAGRTDSDFHIDLCDPIEKIIIPPNIDVVINTSAHFGGTDFQQILQAEDVNVLGVLKLCHACHEAKVKHFISISSTSAYLKDDSEYYGIYSITKKQSDEILLLFCSSVKFPLTILRPSQIYGNQNMYRKRQPFLYAAIDKAQVNEDITIYGNNDPLRNYIHIDDLTQIISIVASKRIEGIYSCTTTPDVSLSQIANAGIKSFSSTSRVHFLKEMKNIPDNVFPYDDLLYKKIGFFPQITIEEGVQRIANYRENKL